MAKKKPSFDDLIVAEEEALATMRYVMDRGEAMQILEELGSEHVVALDFETTGLDVYTSKIRLSCIYHPDHGLILLDHMFCGSFATMAKHMLGPVWAVYNAKFEVKWFDRFVPNQVDLIDVDFLGKSYLGGYPSSLARMCKRDLGVVLDKEEQLSDWSQEKLTNAQLRYAGKDAYYTYKLFEYWMRKISPDQRSAAYVFQDAVRATIECEETGMELDVEAHKENIATWEKKQLIAYKRLRHWTNDRMLPNPGSDKQVGEILETQLGASLKDNWPRTPKTKQLQLSRKVIQPLVAKSPYPFSRWMNALLRYRYYRKYLSTYGETLITQQYLEDMLTYRLNIAQAATGRYSSSSFNIQNIPRKTTVRKAFLPPPGYKYFVGADYSGIEIRVLAELSGDKTLLQDAIYGDVHSGSASAIYHIDLDEFVAVIKGDVPDDYADAQQYFRYKEYRSKAKGFTFQNIYGAGALALSIVLKCTVDEAEAALRKWAERYPDAYNYRHIIYDELSRTGFIPIYDGRTVFVYKQDRTLPVAANYPVQGAAASVMYRAMSHVYDLRNERSTKDLIRLSATVHDEVLLCCNEPDIEAAKGIIEEGMTKGWLDIFPDTDTNNLLDVKSGVSWGDVH